MPGARHRSPRRGRAAPARVVARPGDARGRAVGPALRRRARHRAPRRRAAATRGRLADRAPASPAGRGSSIAGGMPVRRVRRRRQRRPVSRRSSGATGFGPGSDGVGGRAVGSDWRTVVGFARVRRTPTSAQPRTTGCIGSGRARGLPIAARQPTTHRLSQPLAPMPQPSSAAHAPSPRPPSRARAAPRTGCLSAATFGLQQPSGPARRGGDRQRHGRSRRRWR